MKKIPNPYKMKKIRGPVLSEEEFGRAKVRITTYLDEDVFALLRKIAREVGGKYQTILNQILRERLLEEKTGILARIERLEKIILKKRAA